MPDLLRRDAALTAVSALGIAPLTTATATPDAAVAVEPLLAAADAAAVPASLDRGTLGGRAAPAGLGRP